MKLTYRNIQHTAVSANAAISTKSCLYYGCIVVNNTTGGVVAKIFDAVATATGTLTDVITVSAGTNANAGVWYDQGIVMGTGIYVSAITCTTAADNIIVFYGG